MRVKEILDQRSGELLTIAGEAELRDAADKMAKNGVSALVVEAPDGSLAGIITERDIARHFVSDNPLPSTPVSMVMTNDVITCTAEHDVSEIAEIMSDSNIRHLPIVKKGRPVDMVSIRDIVRYHLSALQDENRTLRNLIAAMD